MSNVGLHDDLYNIPGINSFSLKAGWFCSPCDGEGKQRSFCLKTFHTLIALHQVTFGI